MTGWASLVDSARRLLIILAFLSCVLAGALYGFVRALVRAPLAALHGWLGRVLATLCVALLVASCGAPRSKARYVGVYSDKGAPTATFRVECKYHSTTQFGRQDACSAPGAEDLWVRWRVVDGAGRVLWWSDGSEVLVVFPPGASEFQVLVPAGITHHLYTEGARVWRVAYRRPVHP